DPFKLDGQVRDEQLPLLKGAAVDPTTSRLPDPPSGLAPEPLTCSGFSARAPSGANPACTTREQALSSLDQALAIPNVDKRDAAPAELEPGAGLAPGIVRALRAEPAPAECAESIVTPFLKLPPKGTNTLAFSALEGLALAGRLSRLGTHAPTFKGAK